MGLSDVPMRRVLVVGSSGAGKTRLSALLAKRLALPLIHLDFHRFKPGWVQIEREPWLDCASELAARPAWIMEGMWPETFRFSMPRADTLIWLDLPRSTCLRRVMWRALRNFGRRRPELNNCRDVFPTLAPVWKFTGTRIVRGIERFGRHLLVIRVRSDRGTDALAAALEHGAEGWASRLPEKIVLENKGRTVILN